MTVGFINSKHHDRRLLAVVMVVEDLVLARMGR
jgi:hypothetical protein